MGLRELKKEQTRQLIADTAWRLFADRGFDQVTVAEVAREAMVAPATAFNYFPNKEDLFFFRLEAFGSRLLEAIRTRRQGEPALAAFRRYVLQPAGLLGELEAGDPQALERLRTVHRMIAASPALQAREQRRQAGPARSRRPPTRETRLRAARARTRRLRAEAKDATGQPGVTGARGFAERWVHTLRADCLTESSFSVVAV